MSWNSLWILVTTASANESIFIISSLSAMRESSVPTRRSGMTILYGWQYGINLSLWNSFMISW